MSSFKSRVTARLDRFRKRHRKVDHVLRMVTHYGKVDGNAQAGAVTFFGFLSFFPILALAFFAVGVLAHVYPDLRADIRVEVENLLPGVIGNGKDEIPLKTFEDYGGAVGIVGLLGVLYSGLGWLSGMRGALETMFQMPRKEQPNFVFGKLRDVGTLALIGLTMIVSVALSGLVAGFSETVLRWFEVDPTATLPNAVLWVVSHGLAIVASTVLLYTLFKLLVQPHAPRRSLVDGAVLGAIGFELLKGLAYFLIAQTKGQPAFQAFGVTLILVVWINYFSRLVMYAAAYAYTSPAAVRLRQREAEEAGPPASAAVVGSPATPNEGSVARDSDHEPVAAATFGGSDGGSAGTSDGGSIGTSDGRLLPARDRQAGTTAAATATRSPSTVGRHSAAGRRGRNRVAAAAGALAAATGAVALVVRRRARMPR